MLMGRDVELQLVGDRADVPHLVSRPHGQHILRVGQEEGGLHLQLLHISARHRNESALLSQVILKGFLLFTEIFQRRWIHV